MRRRQAVLLLDLVLVTLATGSALLLRDNLEFSLERLLALLPYVATTLLVAAAVLTILGTNRSFWRFSALTDYTRLIIAIIAIVLCSVALHFLIDRLAGVARALPLIQALLMAFLLVGARVVTRLMHLHRQKSRSLVPPPTGAEETVVVVGLNPITELFLRSIDEFASDRIKVVGIVGRSERHSGRTLLHRPILGVPEDIDDIVKTLEVHGVRLDRIVITVAFASLSALARQSLLAIENSSDIRLDFFAERIGFGEQPRAAPEGVPKTTPEPEVVGLSSSELEAASKGTFFRAKRLMDVILIVALGGALFPAIILIGFVVAMDVGLPVIFWQQRPGKHGRPFKLYKFRTMRGAHNRFGERIADEQRSSRIGRFLRRSRLDELPQLVNILIGDMSFVGPRPLLPVDQSAEFAARLLIRPGLTGWAQVAGGRDISSSDKAALDLWYVRNASLWIDSVTIARTIAVVLFGERLDRGALHTAWQELGWDLRGHPARGPEDVLFRHRAA